MRTFSMRSINECLLGYNHQNADGSTNFISTRLFFAAYVNEENPLIDQVLREALSTRIVRRFLGYQSKAKDAVATTSNALSVERLFTIKSRKIMESSTTSTRIFRISVSSFLPISPHRILPPCDRWSSRYIRTYIPSLEYSP